MLNDFHMMVLVVLATQGGIAMLLIVMATLEPAKPEQNGPAKAASPALTYRHSGQRAPALSRHR